MGGDDRTLLGMPGSRLGNSPYRLSQVGPTTSVRTTSGTGGVAVGNTNLAGGLEDPHGNPAPIAPRGNNNPDTAAVGTPYVLCRPDAHRHPMSEKGDPALLKLNASRDDRTSMSFRQLMIHISTEKKEK
jgi:hypothetical protein